MEFPESVNDCDGWLITGSRFGAYEDHAFIPPLEDFIREAYAKAVQLGAGSKTAKAKLALARDLTASPGKPAAAANGGAGSR